MRLAQVPLGLLRVGPDLAVVHLQNEVGILAAVQVTKAHTHSGAITCTTEPIHMHLYLHRRSRHLQYNICMTCSWSATRRP
jgi:hypothetical protein